MWKVATRFKIVGIEVVGLGAYNLLVLLLQLRETHSQSIVQSFGWDYAIIGGVLIAVGLELLSLIKHLPTQQSIGRAETYDSDRCGEELRGQNI